MMVYQIPITGIHVLNITVQILFDILMYKTIGGRAIAYFIFSSFLAGSLHPVAGHFIGEHYVFSKPGKDARDPTTMTNIPETYSYYGPLNILLYNVGLHNEHHDFPAVPWTRLPLLHELAKEFYADLPSHDSLPMIIWHFIFDKEVGLWCRVKRAEGGRKVGASAGSGWTEAEIQS